MNHMMHCTPATYVNNPPQNHHHYYNLAKAHNTHSEKKFNCDICNKSFFSRHQYQLHIENHVDCPFPKCKLTGDFKIIDQHINNQHLLVNFDSFQMDDEAWINERKKRFPTKQRAELRRIQQMERLKRGERIDGNSSRKENKFKNKGTKNATTSSSKTRHFKETKRNRSTGETFHSVDLYDSDTESKFGINAFKGTTSFYESTGELNLFSSNSKMDCELPMLSISDEEDDSQGTEPSSKSEKTMLNNALGSLMGAYGSESEDEPMKQGDLDLSIQNPIHPSSSISSKKRKRAHRERKVLKKVPPTLKNRPPKLRPPTLLERLLSSEIRHERNVILQCVRHIVSNNFFEHST